MADVLSQDEIDALLNAVSTGDISADSTTTEEEPQEKKISNYDFRRPEMLSKDQMRTLQMIHDTFARSYTNSLSGYLRTIVEVNLLAVDQLTYGEFIMSLPDPTCIAILEAKPLNGMCIFEMNPLLIFTIMDRLLGGKGQIGKEVREFTEIEMAIISDIVNKALATLKQSWQHVDDIDFSIQRQETNPQFVQIIEQSETVVSITFEAKIGSSSGVISICFPYICLKPIVSKLSAQRWVASLSQESKNSGQQIQQNLVRANMEMSVTLGRINLKIRDLVNMRKGDVLPLNTRIGQSITAQVGGIDKFVGKAGLIGKKKAFKIEKRIL